MTDKKIFFNFDSSIDLYGPNGNAYAIMGIFSKLAREQEWSKSEINEVLNEARSSNYEHLIKTIKNHCEY